MESTDNTLRKKVVTAVVFAVVTCLGAVTTAAPAIRLLWVTVNLAGCGAVIRRMGAPEGLTLPMQQPEPEPDREAQAQPNGPLHDMHRVVSCEIVAVEAGSPEGFPGNQ